MALRECPECGHDVSDKAEACPNCGHPVNQELSWLSAEASSVPASENFEAQGALIAVLFGAGAIIVGSFLPWASITSIFGTIEIAGTSGDGIITLGAGAVIALAAVVVLGQKRASPAGAVVILGGAAISGFVAINTIGNLAGSIEITETLISTIGGGLWLVLLGAGVAFLAGFGAIPNRDDSTSGSSVAPQRQVLIPPPDQFFSPGTDPDATEEPPPEVDEKRARNFRRGLIAVGIALAILSVIKWFEVL